MKRLLAGLTVLASSAVFASSAAAGLTARGSVEQVQVTGAPP